MPAKVENTMPELSLDDPTMAYIPPAQKASKSLADRGRGKPDARKICNPQPTLELKKSVVRAAGGAIGYANKQWTIVLPGEEGDKSFRFFSREFAALTVGGLCSAIGLEVPV